MGRSRKDKSEKVDLEEGALHLKNVLTYNSEHKDFDDISNLDSITCSDDIEISKLWHMPELIYKKIKQTQHKVKSGFFNFIQSVYFIIDYKLYIWNIENLKIIDVDLEDKIYFVDIVKPKKDIFEDNVKNLLVIGTDKQVSIYALYYDENKWINFKDTKFNKLHKTFEADKILSLNNGRIFIASCDNNVLEYDYTNDKMINLTQSFFSFKNLLSQVDINNKCIAFKVDYNRNLLYFVYGFMLTVVSLGKKSEGFKIVQNINIRNQIQQFNGQYYYEFNNIKDIQIINKSESKNLHLVLLSDKGYNIYLSNKLYDKEEVKLYIQFIKINNLTELSEDVSYFYNRGLHVLANNFNSDSTNYISYLQRLKSNQLNNVQLSTKLEGQVMDIKEANYNKNHQFSINENQHYKLTNDDSINQFYSSNRILYILTTKGLFKLIKLRPIDHLLSIFKNNLIGLDHFIEIYGQFNTLTMLLFLITNNPFSIKSIDEKVNIMLKVAVPTINLELKEKYLNYLNQVAFNKDITNGPLHSIILNNMQKSNEVNFSIGYYSLISYLTYLFQPLFNKPFFQIKKDRHEQSLEHLLTPSTIHYYQYNLNQIVSIIDKLWLNPLNNPSQSEIDLINQMKSIIKKVDSSLYFVQFLQKASNLKWFKLFSQKGLKDLCSIDLNLIFNPIKFNKTLNNIINIWFKQVLNDKVSLHYWVSFFELNCKSIFDIHSIVLSTAEQHLDMIHDNTLEKEKQIHIDHCMLLLDTLKSIVPIEYLDSFVLEMCKYDFQLDALLLIIRNINILNDGVSNDIDNTNLIEHLDRIKVPLDSTLSIFKAYLKNQHDNQYNIQFRYLEVKLPQVLGCCRDDNTFKELVHFFVQNNIIKLLFSFSSPNFIKYLNKDKLENQNLLIDYLCFHNLYDKAYEVSHQLAFSKDKPITIEARALLIQKALVCVKDGNDISKIQQTQKDCDLIKCQQFVHNELFDLSNEDDKLKVIKKYGMQIFSLEQLKQDIEDNDLKKSKIIYFHLFESTDDFNHIKALWKDTLEKIIQKHPDNYMDKLKYQLKLLFVGLHSINTDYQPDYLYSLLKQNSKLNDKNILELILELNLNHLKSLDYLVKLIIEMPKTSSEKLNIILDACFEVIEKIMKNLKVFNNRQLIQTKLLDIMNKHPHLESKVLQFWNKIMPSTPLKRSSQNLDELPRSKASRIQ